MKGRLQKHYRDPGRVSATLGTIESFVAKKQADQRQRAKALVQKMRERQEKKP